MLRSRPQSRNLDRQAVRVVQILCGTGGRKRHDECDARQGVKAPRIQVETNRPGALRRGDKNSPSDRTATDAWWSVRTATAPAAATILIEPNGKPNLPRRCHAEISGSDDRWPGWRPPTGFRRAAR